MCPSKVGSFRRIHSRFIMACSISSLRWCISTAFSSGSLLAPARWLYQSTASSSSMRDTMARCKLRVSSGINSSGSW
jgi:hypothetical protein